jgi:DNA-binding transcriptional MocR family regulator
MTHQNNSFLYSNLAKEIGGKIKDNTFQTGEKLPSIRALHLKLNLSISTVYKAYIELEKQGFIEARPKSGYYVRCQKEQDAGLQTQGADNPESFDFPFSKTDALTPHKISIPSFVNHVLKTTHRTDFLQLGTAMISPELLPFGQLNKVMKEVTRQEMKSILSYSLAQGDLELRRQLALRSTGILEKLSAKDFVITNGCTEALALGLRAVTKAGDTIAIESPAFFGILPLLEDLGLRAVEIPSDPETGLKLGVLEKALKKHPIKACLVTPNFNNPLGSLMPDSKKRKLVQLAYQNQMPIIEDNINTELYYTKKRPSLLKAFDSHNLVITCSSFSKTLAPGLRIGWIIPGPRFMDSVLKLKAGFSVSSSTLDQRLLARFMSEGNYDRHLRSLRSRTKKQISDYITCVKKCFPEDVKINNPAGGILLWIEMRSGVDGVKVYQTALDNKISLLPGIVFSACGQYRNFIRLGCGYPFLKKTERALAFLGSIISNN